MRGRGFGSMVSTARRGIVASTTSAPRRTGDRPYRFTEVLPREESWKDACEPCQRDVEFHEGPHAARKYQFVARGVAAALVAVGAGSTYRDAAGVGARAAAAAAGRPAEPGAALFATWVAGDGLGRGVRAGRVEAYRPREWPASGSLLLDDLPFRVRDPDTGRFRIAFRCSPRWGMTADARGCGAWRRSRPSPSLTGRRFWARSAALRHGSFATTTRGSRTRSVLASPTLSCTCASGTFATRLERLLDKIRAEGAYRDAVDELLPQVEAAFTGPAFWAAFLERAHAAEIPRVSECLNTTGRVVAEQFARRGLRWKRPADMPLSTSPLDASSTRSGRRSARARTGSRTARGPIGC